MPADRTGARRLEPQSPTWALPDEYITVSRSAGDLERSDRIAGCRTWHPILTAVEGGHRAALRLPMIGVYVWCSDVANVAHDGRHGHGCPHSILIIVSPELTDPVTYTRLWSIAEHNSSREGRAATKRASRRRARERRRCRARMTRIREGAQSARAVLPATRHTASAPAVP